MKRNTKQIVTKREYREQHADQIAVIGEEAQERLRQARVHVAGLGGIGAHVVLDVAKAGVGRVTSNDPQRLELSNLSRWPAASVAQIGMPKAQVIRSLLKNDPTVTFEAVEARTESPQVRPLLHEADLIICCSNTISSKVAAVQAAIRSARPLIDVAVADGRRELSGAIRIFDPAQRERACPACFAAGLQRTVRGEGLVSTVIACTAALAAHLAISLLADPSNRKEWGNYIRFDLEQLTIERIAVARRHRCLVCAQ